jgi:hypothetical protein
VVVKKKTPATAIATATTPMASFFQGRFFMFGGVINIKIELNIQVLVCFL